MKKVDLIKKIGVRGNITVKVREAVEKIYAPEELYEFSLEYGDRTMEEARVLFDRWHGRLDGRIRLVFGPQGADFLSRDRLLAVKAEAERRGARIQMHTQQGDRETKQIVKRYGMRPVQWLDSIGLMLKQCREAAEEVGTDCRELFWSVNGTNAEFMRQDKL